MSEYDEQPLMTRRERRLRDLAETGALDLSEALQQAKEPVASAEDRAATTNASDGSTVGAAANDIEISPLNEDGTPRSRREIRQLREAALAAQAETEASAPVEAEAIEAEVEAEAEVEVEPGVEVEAEPEVEAEVETVETAADDVATEDAILDGIFETAKNGSEAPETSALDFDSLLVPPTAPFSVEDVREAERASVAEGDAEPLSESEPELEAVPEEAPDASAETSAKPKRRFPWKRNKPEAVPVEQDLTADVPEAATAEPVADAPADVESDYGQSDADESIADPADAPVEQESEPVQPDSEQPESVQSEPIPVEAEPELDAEPEPELAEAPVTGRRRRGGVVETESAAPEETAEVSEPEPTDKSDSQKYSFPDIQPPEEWRSVFDDPTSRTVGGQGASEKGDFDDLISRAVAQEGATGTSNTSALILPTMPSDTGGLSGPLGATGELYIAGSIDLPRSLGETGGHSSLHDSLQMEPISMSESGEITETTDHGPMPVSARHAVSARMPSDMPMVAKPTKEKSKLPLVLTLSGGGLLIIIVGLGVWGATNGMFAG